MKRLWILLLVGTIGFGCTALSLQAADQPGPANLEILQQDNLVAWCVAAFDAKKRPPAARAQMLKELGLLRCAYDWRAEHVPTFEQEILEYQKHGIDFFAFWATHERAFQLFEQHQLHPQFWLMLPQPEGASQAAKVDEAVRQVLPVVERTKKLGSKLGLYNHGGWSGEPENLVAICQRLRAAGHEHVGIVYNFHHAHDHIQDWPESLRLMLPYLHCLNLNGMNAGAEPKILPIGQGEHELEMIRTVLESGYDGPIGILDHRPEMDSRVALQENLAGLAKIRRLLGQPAEETSPSLPAATPGEFSQLDDESPRAAPLSEAEAREVAELVDAAEDRGDALRGARVFADAKTACMSCHRVGVHGGNVGPDLAQLAPQRTLEQLVTSVLWPAREILPKYRTSTIQTADGRVISGYPVDSDSQQVTLLDPSSGAQTRIERVDIENRAAGGTLMPDRLLTSLSKQQQIDLVRFLGELRRDAYADSPGLERVLRHAGRHHPVEASVDPAPLRPTAWPHHTHPVNRDRIYDFYTKQAELFRTQEDVPRLLSPYPGLDGGVLGHWGNQDESTWASDRWNATRLGTVQAGVLHGDGLVVPRGICIRLGDQGQLSACFNPDTLTYDAVWRDGFVRFSSVRHGFLSGLQIEGTPLAMPSQTTPNRPFRYLGFYRSGNRVVFAYRIGDETWLDAAWAEDGQFTREAAPLDQHTLRHVVAGGPAQWPEILETDIIPGKQQPLAIDTIELPEANPYNALLFCSGHDFLADGTAMVCTMQGDVWHVAGLESGVAEQGTARWRRFAAGLHQPQGLVVVDDQVFVQCRDQLLRLVDRNLDGEADFYECSSNAFETSPGGHDFICGLERDAEGAFYTASSNQGLVRISPDGQTTKVLATGLRNPDGLGLLANGDVTVPSSEGNWVPASMVCLVPHDDRASATATGDARPRHFGYGGPVDDRPPDLPLVYLPRALDNSSAGQTVVPEDAWGPLGGKLLHFSFGRGTWFTILRDEVDGQPQGAAIPMTGDFHSGVHRGRFSPRDGHLYVTGQGGWGTYTPRTGCLQRIRATGEPYQIATDFHVYENGIEVTFAHPVDRAVATDRTNHFAQCWNYRYSGAYGSPEYSPSHPGMPGHDVWQITAVHALPDGHTLFLEIPELQPVSQLHLRMHVNPPGELLVTNPAGDGHDLFLTVHRLDGPRTDLPGYAPASKTIAAHPIEIDMTLEANAVPNPWLASIADARAIELRTAGNLSYETRELRVAAGEPVALTLVNPDVVPHNWALVRPGALQEVGEAANRLIADPAAFARQYIPETELIVCYTDIVNPGTEQTVYFQAPSDPGRYPFLCTFPGHWMVMNGVMVVGE